jgi:type II secretory pathway component PulC
VIGYEPVKISTEDSRSVMMEPPLVSQVDEKWAEEVINKNLFVPSRRYTKEELVTTEPQPAPEEPEMPQVTLKGIIYNQYGQYIAILQIDSEKPVRLGEGDSIRGLKVERIDDHSVSLLWGDRVLELTFRKVTPVK